MKKTLLLSLALVASSVVAEDLDKRQTLELAGPQREHVLEEMRALLSGTQQILDALSRDDMAVVARVARPLGMGMAHKAEDHLKGALPEAFMRLGMSVHQDFDRIAADAEAIKDPKLTLRQVSHTMSKCVACHAAYRLGAEMPPSESDHRHGRHEH
jgi:hypothetical protein